MEQRSFRGVFPDRFCKIDRAVAIMKKADRLPAHGIAFAPVPRHDLGEAINDRIARAAAPRPETSDAT